MPPSFLLPLLCYLQEFLFVNDRHPGPSKRGLAVRVCRPRGWGSRRSLRSDVTLATFYAAPRPRLEFGAIFRTRSALTAVVRVLAGPARVLSAFVGKFLCFFGFCPWKLQPGPSWVGFFWSWWPSAPDLRHLSFSLRNSLLSAFHPEGHYELISCGAALCPNPPDH